ncbi:DUF4079 domain-containing protein [Mameliella alba]|nr:DUF4079 domain-containing protein [Antarctobacter heliothermus]MBY6143058.1 DUF4079 domain-containing protein [Mameliella alba]MCA0953218.1 DUF4079 domain-containing protein [Mameliella alba]
MAQAQIDKTAKAETGEQTGRLSDSRAQLDLGLNFLFLAAFPLLLWVFQESFAGIATAIALMWVFSLALRLIASGQQVHHDYARAEVAQAPRIPRKVIGSLMIGFVVMVLAGHKYDNLWMPALAGLIAVGLAIAAFGLDPMRNKGSERARQVAALNSAETAMAALADRIAALEDPALSLKIEAARRLVLRPMRQTTDDARTSARLYRPVRKVIAILDEEVRRLETAWTGQGKAFARRRFLAKLEVMTESFEAFAVHNGVRGARDAFERQADMLIDRMPRESAA